MGPAPRGKEITRIGVVGGSAVAHGIAINLAAGLSGRGVSVVLVDPAGGRPDAAPTDGAVQRFVEYDVEHATEISALAGADLVVEAAAERADRKHEILALIEKQCPNAILASHSTHLEPEAVFEKVTDKRRCVCIHYAASVDSNPVVEIVPTLSTDPAVVRCLMKLLEACGKMPIRAKGRFGYALGPISYGVCEAAALLVEEGVADSKTIDAIAAGALGAGPFTAMNATGAHAAARHILNEMHAYIMPWFHSPAPLDEKVVSGEPWAVASEDEQVEVGGAELRTMADLLKGAYFGLAAEVVDSGVASLGDLDVAVESGLGMRPPFAMMNEIGIARALELVRAYAVRYPNFKVARVLENQAGTGKRFKVPMVLREDLGDFAVVTIRRPRVLNALDPSVVEQLGETFEEIGRQTWVKGVVLTGFGKRAFVSGADVRAIASLKTSEEAAAFALSGQAVFNAIENLGKPVVCAMNGLAFGGGNELAMACHARLAAAGQKALAGQPEPKLGIIPGYGGTQRLPRWIGIEAAWPILRSGGAISSTEAVRLGLVRFEVEGDVVAAAISLLEDVVAGKTKLEPIRRGAIEVPGEMPEVDIGGLSRRVDDILKKTVIEGAGMTLGDGLRLEARRFGECLMTRDARTGLANFLKYGAKQPAVFVHE